VSSFSSFFQIGKSAAPAVKRGRDAEEEDEDANQGASKRQSSALLSCSASSSSFLSLTGLCTCTEGSINKEPAAAEESIFVVLAEAPTLASEPAPPAPETGPSPSPAPIPVPSPVTAPSPAPAAQAAPTGVEVQAPIQAQASAPTVPTAPNATAPVPAAAPAPPLVFGTEAALQQPFAPRLANLAQINDTCNSVVGNAAKLIRTAAPSVGQYVLSFLLLV